MSTLGIATPALRAVIAEDYAYSTVLTFSRQFGEGHLALAMHVAVPLGLSPELVHLLRINFVPRASFIAEADLLLSPLCTEVGGQLYEMIEQVREVLLDELLADPEYGPDHARLVASFIMAHSERAASRATTADERAYHRAQQWAAWARLDPEGTANQLGHALRAGLDAGDVDEALRIARLTDAVSDSLTEEYELVRYAAAIERLVRGDAAAVVSLVGDTSREVQVGEVVMPSPARAAGLLGIESNAEPVLEPPLDFAALRQRLRGRRPPSAKVLDRIEELATTRMQGWVVLVGASGSGKSATVAHLLDRLEGGEQAVAQHFFSEVREPAAAAESIRRQLAALLPPDYWSRPLGEVLGAFAEGYRIVIVIDSLHRSDGWAEAADPLALLPVRLPPGVVVVCTARPSAELERWMARREPITELTLPLLGAEVFIAYAVADENWADWVWWQLEDAGYPTTKGIVDVTPGSGSAFEMHRALASSERIIGLVSGSSLASNVARRAWEESVNRLITVRIEDVEPEPVIRASANVDLVGIDESAARERLLGAMGRSARSSGRPSGSAAFDEPAFPAVAARLWTVPDRNPDFVGREGMLAALAEAGSTVAVVGLAGMGKTQLITEYAHRRRDQLDLAYWIRSETFDEDLQALGEAMGINAGAVSAAWLIARVRRRLEREARWLLIIDDADGRSQELLSPPINGQVIIACRHTNWPFDVPQLRLDALPPEEAVELVLRLSGSHDETAARRLSDELGRYPAALSFAARAARGGRSLDNADLVSETVRGFVSVLGPTFRAVEEELPVAGDLLRILAFVAPDDILQSLLPGVDDLDWSLDVLIRHLLVSMPSGGADDSVAVNRFVQRVVAEWLGAEAGQWAARAVRLVDQAFPDDPDDVATRDECARLLPHALAVTGHPEVARTAAVEASDLLTRVSTYLRSRSGFELAREVMERAVSFAAQQPAGADPERARHVLDSLSPGSAGVVGQEPEQLLGFASRLVCGHGGVVQVQHGEETGLPPVITEADVLDASIVGCMNIGVSVKPCQSVISVRHRLSARVRRDGSPALLADAWGLTDGIPPGAARFEVQEVQPPTPALVFISYSAYDSWSNEVVEQLRRELRDFSSQIALCSSFDPAVPTQETLDSLLAACSGGVVLLSPAALQSHWIAYETSMLLHRSDADSDFDLDVASEPSTSNEQIAETRLFAILGLADRQKLSGGSKEVSTRIGQRMEKRLMH